MTAKCGILSRNFHLQIFVCLSKQSYDLLQGANERIQKQWICQVQRSQKYQALLFEKDF